MFFGFYLSLSVNI